MCIDYFNSTSMNYFTKLPLGESHVLIVEKTKLCLCTLLLRVHTHEWNLGGNEYKFFSKP